MARDTCADHLSSDNSERSQIHRREVVVKTILHTLDQPPSKETTNPTRARDNRTTNLAVSTHPTYASAMEIVHASRNLLKDYEDMSQKLSASSPKEEQQIADEWQKNVDHTSRILQIGYKKALKDVESIIGIGHTETEGDKDTEMTDQQDDGEVEDGELMKRQCDTGLEKTLRYAERGVKRLAKGLPDDTPV